MAEARAEQRRADQGPPEQAVDLVGLHERDQARRRGRDLPRREGQQDAVVDVGGLGHEAERAPHLLLQHHAPGAVHAHAEDGVDHRVAAAHLVRERLDHDAAIVGHAVEDLARLREPGLHRRRGARLEPALGARPRLPVGRVQPVRGLPAQPSDGDAQIVRARGMLALPERDRRRHAVGVLDQDPVGADLQDLPRVRAEQEDVAGQALGDELLVERADLEVGLGDEDVVEPGVGDRASRGQREEAGAAPCVEPVVDAVPEDAGGRALDLGGQRLGHRADDEHEVLAGEPAIRRRAAEALVELVEPDRFGSHGGHDLLGQDVERRFRHRDPIELPPADRSDDRRGLDQLLALGHDDAALGDAREQVARPAHALERGGDVPGRLHLDDQVDGADVDAELERRRRHERLQLAVLEAVLGFQAGPARERAVMGGDEPAGDAVVEVAGQPLGRPPALREDQRRAVRLHQLGDLLLSGVVDGVARGRQEVVDGGDHLDVEVAREAGVDGDGIVAGAAGEERQRRFHRAHRGRAPDPLRTRSALARLDQRLQPLERQRQVDAALVAHERVHLVHDDEARAGQRRPEPLAGQQDVERFRRRDEDVRGTPGHRLPGRRQRVAGADGDADLRQERGRRPRPRRGCPRAGPGGSSRCRC